MAISQINTNSIATGAVGTTDIANGAVGSTQLASTLDLTGKTVTLPAGTTNAGKVLQVVQDTMTSDFQTSSTNGSYDITGLSATITPSSTSSKILVIAQVNASAGGSDARGGLLLVRNSTDLFVADSWGSRARMTVALSGPVNSNNMPPSSNISYLDSPSTTSATTYKVKAVVCDNSAVSVNRPGNTTDTTSIAIGTSSIILLEIAA